MENYVAKPVKSYFGACNSYNGFVSFFDRLFDPIDYDRIYVIKGGPGTGKSSFMKKILSTFCDNADSEAIYCSSDPKSLDGVILERNGIRVALLDGTAPHETDAKVPGAVDEIINLGEMWDKKWLESQKERILKLNREKKEAYITAYKYLDIARSCNDTETELAKRSYSKEKARKAAFNIASRFASHTDGKCKTRLISSFGKSGIYVLDTLKLLGNKYCNLIIPDIYYTLFTKDLREALDSFSIKYTAFPSAPDLCTFDAFYIDGEGCVIGRGFDGEGIDVDVLGKDISITVKERTRVAGEIKKFALDESQRHFAIASEFHFSLEEIYSSVMNFDLVDEQFLCVRKEIEEILGIN